VRRLLAAALLIPAWSLGCGTPAPALHPDVLLIAGSDGGRTIVRNPGGTVLGRLPAGILTLDLSGGDDIAEAYLVAGTVVSSVQPSRGYALTQVATLPSTAQAALLLPAPRLTTYVGQKTVLVVSMVDGELAGYQHGTRLWSVAPGPEPARLLAVGSRAFLGRLGGWSELTVETGATTQQLNGIRCDSPGPLAVVGGSVVSDCVGMLDPGGETVPNAQPLVFASGAATMLAFPNGEVWRLQGAGARLAFKLAPWALPPAASLDGSQLYVPTPSGIEQVDVATGRHHALTSAAGVNPSLALSRDGNFLYALAAGVLRSFRLDTGGRVDSVTTGGVAIERVVGG
jgi:hypothetical protein